MSVLGSRSRINLQAVKQQKQEFASTLDALSARDISSIGMSNLCLYCIMHNVRTNLLSTLHAIRISYSYHT